jgi:hypothetical protein
MNSKQLVHDTLEFGGPARIATLARARESDVEFVSLLPPIDFTPKVEGEDEWGCVWQKASPEQSFQGIVRHNPLADWTRFETYALPDPYAGDRFRDLRHKFAGECERYAEKFVVGSLDKGPMHLLDHLLGFENFMVALVENPDRIDALLEGVFSFLRGLVEQYAAYPYMDAVMLYDDQAMQTGPFFSMDTWRRTFKPRYKKLCALVHRVGLKIIFHSCGNLQDHLPELCDCGVDAIDNKQPSLWMHGPSTGRLVGSVCFCTCIDMVKLLSMRPVQVPKAVGDLIETLSTPRGGFLGTIFNFTNPSLEAEILNAMWDAFCDFRW